MVADFIFLGSKIIVDGDCSNETKRSLHLGRKAMTNLYSMLKSRDITLPTNSVYSKLCFSIVFMYRYETIKKAEQLRMDAFEQWC